MALIGADVDEVTLVVVTVNVAVVFPAATTTLGGAAAAELSLHSPTHSPPEGAAPLSVTVAVDEVPPATEAGLSDSAVSATPAVIVSEAVALTLL